MTKRIGSAITGKVVSRMTGEKGVNAGLASLIAGGQITAAPLEVSHVRAQHIAAEVEERSSGAKYPAMNVYCEKLVNNLVEKFRRFSGHAQMTIEVRHSQDRLEGLQDTLETYADAVAQALDATRGDWGDGMFYAGGYEATFSAVKHGGRNFIQTAKITFEIGVSRS